MKKKKRWLFILGLIIFICLIFILIKGCGGSLNENPIVFKDSTFEKMIKESLNKDKIYPSDLKDYSGILIAADRLMSFSGKGKNIESVILYGYDSFEYNDKRYTEFGSIKSLEDLSNFPKLVTIMVYLQPDIDYNTIPNKEKVFNLQLSQNKIEDLSFLKGFNTLSYLGLSSNQVSNLDGIEYLTKLKRLSFNSNNIVNIDLLGNLINLEHLDLTFNKIKDISALSSLTKLEYLSLYDNEVSDITALSNLTSIKQLYLNNNNIVDISPLKDFKSFDSLDVSGNKIENMEVISHIDNVIK